MLIQRLLQNIVIVQNNYLSLLKYNKGGKYSHGMREVDSIMFLGYNNIQYKAFKRKFAGEGNATLVG